MPRKHGDFPSVRDAILYTASSLFTQKGVHGTSLGDIAAEAKLSKGTLYYYYSTKDELIVTITDDCLCHMTDILFSWVDGLNREEALRPALIRLFESLMADGHNARLYCVLCAECASEDTPHTRAHDGVQAKVAVDAGAGRAEAAIPQRRDTG